MVLIVGRTEVLVTRRVVLIWPCGPQGDTRDGGKQVMDGVVQRRIGNLGTLTRMVQSKGILRVRTHMGVRHKKVRRLALHDWDAIPADKCVVGGLARNAHTVCTGRASGTDQGDACMEQSKQSKAGEHYIKPRASTWGYSLNLNGTNRSGMDVNMSRSQLTRRNTRRSITATGRPRGTTSSSVTAQSREAEGRRVNHRRRTTGRFQSARSSKRC